MDDRDTIRRRIIDRAVDLFNEKNPNGGGLFTTAHYGQAMKAEFKTPGPTLDGETSGRHLSQMGDIVEKAGGSLWRRKPRQAVRGTRATEDESEATVCDPELEIERKIEQGVVELLKIERKVEQGVMEVLSDQNKFLGVNVTTWWTASLMAAALHRIEEEDDLEDGLLENMVGIVLYAMAVDGRVISQPNMLVDGARTTTFTLAPSNVDVDDVRPPFEGSPDDESFGR